MSASITAATVTDRTNALFAKLDTKQKGYIDAADLESATGAGDSGRAAELFKQLDADSDGKVTKSELSTALQNVGDELAAQSDQSRVKAASGGAPARTPHGGGRAPAASATETTTKYVAAADTNRDGTVSADEDAAYKKLLAQAEAKAQAQIKQYAENSGAADSASVGIDVSA